MTQPNTHKHNPNRLTAITLHAASVGELHHHIQLLNPAWDEPADCDRLSDPIAEFAVEVHDLRPVAVVIGEAGGSRLAPIWDRDPDLRAAAKPIFRRAVQGVIAHLDQAMRRHGWSQVAVDTGHTHHGGARWERDGEGVSLHVCVQPRLPAALLKPEPGEHDQADGLPWPREGTVAHLVIRPLDPKRAAGHDLLIECLAETLWRREDFQGSLRAAIDGIVLSEVAADRCRWAEALGVVYFRRAADGTLPEALQSQLRELRGKVVIREIAAGDQGELWMSNGTLLRPDGETPELVSKRYQKHDDSPEGPHELPDMLPGEILVVRPQPDWWRHLVHPGVTRIAPGGHIPDAVVRQLHRRNRQRSRGAIERAVRERVRWQLEDTAG